MKAKLTIKENLKRLMIIGIIALTGLTPAVNTYAMTNTTQQIIASETKQTPNYATSSAYKLYLNGEKTNVSKFVVVNNRTFLPAREVANLLNAQVDWDGTNRVASFAKDNTLIEVPIGYNKADVNGKATQIDTDKTTVSLIAKEDNLTYLPIRFLGENLGVNVKYYADTKIIHFYTGDKEPELKLPAANTSVQLHKFFKDRGGVILEGFKPKSGNFADCVDLNGDGKIGKGKEIFDMNQYNSAVKLEQQTAMTNEFLSWYQMKHPAPTTKPSANSNNTPWIYSQDKNWMFDTFAEVWRFNVESPAFQSELQAFNQAISEMAATSTGSTFS